MADVTEDENNTSIQDFLCISRLFGIQHNIILSALIILLSITAILGNALIIFILQKTSSLHPPSKLLLGCLATTDLCVGLITQPLRVVFLLSPDHSKRCHYTEITSKGMAFIFCGVSLLTMTAISVDRLLAKMLGLRYRHVVTLRRVWVFVVSLWVSAIAIAIPLIYNFVFVEYIACALILLCLSTSTFCFTKIYFKLRRHQAQLNHQGQPRERRTPLNMVRYKKTVSNALWVQITLVACYLPYGITVATFAITKWRTPGIRELALEAAAVVLMLNSSLNPFIYAWKIKEIRQSVKDTIRQLFCFSS